MENNQETVEDVKVEETGKTVTRNWTENWG